MKSMPLHPLTAALDARLNRSSTSGAQSSGSPTSGARLNGSSSPSVRLGGNPTSSVRLSAPPVSICGKRARPWDAALKGLCLVVGGGAGLLALLLLGYILVRGLPQVDWAFLSTCPSILRKTQGVLPNLVNTLSLIALTLLGAVPLGIGGAVYLNEYAERNAFTKIIESTTEALAGIPSILYGLFGTVLFCRVMGMGYSILAGALTLSIMVLPTVICTTKEALSTVLPGYREGALGLGASKWQVIRTILLPCCRREILTSVILSVGRIAGESAALIVTAGIATDLPRSLWGHLSGSGATLAVQLYQYAERGENGAAFGVAAVLVLVVLVLNLGVRLFAGSKNQTG